MFISTGFYSGYLPKAPGTWGSLVGLLLFFLLHTLSLEIYLAVVAGIFLLGTFVAGEAEKIMDHQDRGAGDFAQLFAGNWTPPGRTPPGRTPTGSRPVNVGP